MMYPKGQRPIGWYLFWGLIIAGAIVGVSILIGSYMISDTIDSISFSPVIYQQ